MFEIGQWVRRKEQGIKFHLAESMVNEAAVTRCGRRMKPTTGAGDLEVHDDPPDETRCAMCKR